MKHPGTSYSPVKDIINSMQASPLAWVSAIMIVTLMGGLIASGGGYLVLTKLEAYFAFVLSIDFWKNILIYPLGTIILLLLVEASVIGWNKSTIKRFLSPSRSAQNDIFMFLLVIFRVASLLRIFLTFGLVLIIQKSIPEIPSFNISNLIGNPFLEVVVWFVVVDFLRYWLHFFSHRIGFLWESHKFHHSATEFTFITTARSHAIEVAFTLTSLAFILALLGIPAQTLPYLIIIKQIHAYLIHSNLPWRFGWAGRWLIISPYAHRIHHSMEPTHFDKNFGSILPIWDRIFGTWSTETKETGLIAIGLPENVYNQHNFFYDYWLCTLNTMKALVSLLLKSKSGYISPRDESEVKIKTSGESY